MAKNSDKSSVWAATPGKHDEAQEARWRAEDDLRTIERYKEIEKDKGRYSMAKKMAKEKIEKLKGLC